MSNVTRLRTIVAACANGMTEKYSNQRAACIAMSLDLTYSFHIGRERVLPGTEIYGYAQGYVDWFWRNVDEIDVASFSKHDWSTRANISSGFPAALEVSFNG